MVLVVGQPNHLRFMCALAATVRFCGLYAVAALRFGFTLYTRHCTYYTWTPRINTL